jgi:hypothetical protein
MRHQTTLYTPVTVTQKQKTASIAEDLVKVEHFFPARRHVREGSQCGEHYSSSAKE